MEALTSTETVAHAIGRFSPELEPYILRGISEVAKSVEKGKEVDEYRRGSDAEVIDLDFQGTKCVGKVLHPIFFEVGNTGRQIKLEKFFKEIKLLSEMDHPNVVKFRGIYYKQFSSLSFELPVLVMEKMEYSLTQYLSTHEKGSIPEDKAIEILLDVAKGLVYLHEEMKVAHRDLTSNNILLAANLSAKIADLGSARVLDRPGGWNSLVKLTKQPGTPDFMPPEALEANPRYTVSVDVFSFGCVTVHLCTHKWPTPIGRTAQDSIISEFNRRQEYILEMGDSDLLPLVRQCLEDSSDKRPVSADVKLLLENIIKNRQIAEFTKRHGKMLQQYILQELPQGDHCVGEVLHPAIFDFSIDPSGMQNVLKDLFAEIKLLSKMKHSNIVCFIGIYYRQGSSLPELVKERMKCSLNQYLSDHEKGPIPKDKILKILLDVSSGLVYLHEEIKVTHGDLSSNNILLAADLSAKIADLGSARVLGRPGGWNPLPIKHDSMDFMPPEVFKDPPEYTPSGDVFSFGCVIIHLCTHKWPSPTPLAKMFIDEIERRQEYISEMNYSHLLPMVLNCLDQSNTERPASVDIMSSLQAQTEERIPDYTIVLTGITGTGKSTAGNFFLNGEHFAQDGGLLPVTEKCSAATSTICARTVKIIDTPGFFDGFTPDKDHLKELSRAITLAKDGIHAFGFVMSDTRYTVECERAVYQLLHFKGIQPFLFILLTHAQNKGATKAETDEYMQQILSNRRCAPSLKNLIQLVRGRVMMVESSNKAADYCAQKRIEFMAMIESIHKTNEYKMYKNFLLQKTSQLYEELRLHQHEIIRIKRNELLLNTEKLNQLKQDASNISNKSSEEINKKIATLTKYIETLQSDFNEIVSSNYLERLTQKILIEKMEKADVHDEHLIGFLEKCIKAGCFMGTLIESVKATVGILTGSTAYSSVEVLGRFGGHAGYIVGRTAHSFKEHHCNEQ